MPVYHYDHIIDWHKTHRHSEDEIILLCPYHHEEKTKGLLPRELVEEANGNPRNRKRLGSKAHPLHFNGSDCEIIIAGNRFTVTQNPKNFLLPFLIWNVAPVSFQIRENELFLNVGIADETGKDLCRIADNELVYATDAWDIKFVGSKLTLFDAPHKAFLQIEFKPPSKIIISQLRVRCGDVDVRITSEEMKVLHPNGSAFTLGRGGGTIDAPIGILVGPAPTGIGVAIDASM